MACPNIRVIDKVQDTAEYQELQNIARLASERFEALVLAGPHGGGRFLSAMSKTRHIHMANFVEEGVGEHEQEGSALSCVVLAIIFIWALCEYCFVVHMGKPLEYGQLASAPLSYNVALFPLTFALIKIHWSEVSKSRISPSHSCPG